MQKSNSKIPGLLPPPPKTEIDGKINDLSTKTIPELLELRERQEKLLNNGPFISKLPDKGEKIKSFHDKIVQCLTIKHEENETCQLMESLKLDGVDTKTIQDIEWEGKVHNKRDYLLDSDDDSEPEDVIHILSQSTAQERIVKVDNPEKLLITAEDLQRIGEIPHVKYLVNKAENKTNPVKLSGQFKPYKTTISDVHDFKKEIIRKRGKHWEVTAATPPPSIHGPAKTLNLEESLKLQQDYNRHMKEIEVKHAAEKLMVRMGIKMKEIPLDTAKFGTYREADSDSETDSEGSDLEVHDDEPEKGGVVFTVMK